MHSSKFLCEKYIFQNFPVENPNRGGKFDLLYLVAKLKLEPPSESVARSVSMGGMLTQICYKVESIVKRGSRGISAGTLCFSLSVLKS